jgi:hypothetical protein
VVALVWLMWLIRNRPGREEIVEGIGLGAESVAKDSTTETFSTQAAVETDELPNDDVPDPAATKDPTSRP